MITTKGVTTPRLVSCDDMGYLHIHYEISGTREELDAVAQQKNKALEELSLERLEWFRVADVTE